MCEDDLGTPNMCECDLGTLSVCVMIAPNVCECDWMPQVCVNVIRHPECE